MEENEESSRLIVQSSNSWEWVKSVCHLNYWVQRLRKCSAQSYTKFWNKNKEFDTLVGVM